MQKHFYFLSPVEVVKVTSQNLTEVAEWCGGSVQETESRRVEGRMDSYVWVPTPKGTNISWAFPGMFVTKRLVLTLKNELRGTWAVFRRDYFDKNYFQNPKAATDATWERDASEKLKPTHGDVIVTTSMAEVMKEAISKMQEHVDEMAEQAGLETKPVELPKHIQKIVDAATEAVESREEMNARVGAEIDAATPEEAVDKISSTTETVYPTEEVGPFVPETGDEDVAEDVKPPAVKKVAKKAVVKKVG